MKLLAVFAVLLAASPSYAQSLNCNVGTAPLYTACQVDLTVAIDMSTAMVNTYNVDQLVASVYNLTSRYAYGSNTETSVITFGAGGIDSSNFVNDFKTLCQLINSEQSQSHQNGLYSANLATVLNTYKINQPANAREYQRVLIVLTAIDDQTQVLNAKPIADSLRVDDNVQIITVTVGKYASDYLYLLGNQSYASLSYYIDASTLDSIGYASCLNSGFIYTTVPYYPPTTTTTPPTVYTTRAPTTVGPTSAPPSNGTDGLLCATNHKNAWLDVALVLELSEATASQWDAIVGNVMSYIAQLTLSNSPNRGHTSRVSIIGYTSAKEATLLYALTDTQTIRNIKFALNSSRPINVAGGTPNIASGLHLANDHLTKTNSFRVKGVVLYAATYDDSSTSNPVEAANELKADLIKIVTVSYDAANGVNTPKISALSSPGLALTSKDTLPVFASIIAQLNCRCPAGWTQLVVNNAISYADCFFYQDTNNLQAFSECDSSLPNNTLALAYTPARVDFLTQLVSNSSYTTTPTNEISIGLSRPDGYSQWTWSNVYPYSGYPSFAVTPSTSDVYGYLSAKSGPWSLYADDGMTNGRFYVCQIRSCDTDNICDLTGS
uniref:VWFA domain-containing protein n=1 Tax=Panagrellus redivivus TaxID=6233 RepID=A0A7E4V9V6_PANRE